VRSSTHVSYLLTVASVNAGRLEGPAVSKKGREARIAAAAVRKKTGDLGSLLSILILFFTVIAVLAIGILSSYGSVIGILHTFANQSRRPAEPPALGRARAAHASGD